MAHGHAASAFSSVSYSDIDP